MQMGMTSDAGGGIRLGAGNPCEGLAAACGVTVPLSGKSVFAHWKAPH
jgi:hypothetical protein